MIDGTKISRKIVGFSKKDQISIKSDSYFDAFYQYGKKVKKLLTDIFYQYLDTVPLEKQEEILNRSLHQLHQLEIVANSSYFTHQGINYLNNYLQAFYGYSQGTGLTHRQIAFLQTEVDLGCQTMIVQDQKTHAINLIHVEEDSNYSRFGKNPYKYKLVKMKLPNKKITFFSYPELVGWGPAISINETTGLIQAIIDLYPIAEKEFKDGYIFSSILAFIATDCGDPAIVKEIFNQLKNMPNFKLIGGYSMHLAKANIDIPIAISYEFIHNYIKQSPYKANEQTKYLAHSNCPTISELKSYAVSSKPKSSEKWNFHDARLYVEMKLRQERLQSQANSHKWNFSSAEKAIKNNLKLLADPTSDLNKYYDEKNRVHYYYSCLPSRWAVSHLAVFINKNKLTYQIGKLTPPPIKGNEYTLKYKPNFTYQKDISQLAQKEIKKYQKNKPNP